MFPWSSVAEFRFDYFLNALKSVQYIHIKCNSATVKLHFIFILVEIPGTNSKITICYSFQFFSFLFSIVTITVIRLPETKLLHSSKNKILEGALTHAETLWHETPHV